MNSKQLILFLTLTTLTSSKHSTTLVLNYKTETQQLQTQIQVYSIIEKKPKTLAKSAENQNFPILAENKLFIKENKEHMLVFNLGVRRVEFAIVNSNEQIVNQFEERSVSFVLNLDFVVEIDKCFADRVVFNEELDKLDVYCLVDILLV